MLLEMTAGLVVSAPIIYFAGRVLGRKTGYIVFSITAICLAIVALQYPAVSSGSVFEENYSWAMNLNLDLGFRIDGLSWVYAIAVCIVFSMVSLYSMPYMAGRSEKALFPADYYPLLILIFAGLLGVLFATNTLLFYIFFELMIIPAWALIYLYGYVKKERVALTFFIWSQISGMFILIGFIGSYLQSSNFKLDITGYNNLWFVFIGFAIKLAVLGFHFWLPPSYAEAPTSLSTIMGSVMTGIGSYGMLRMTLPLMHEHGSLLAIWGFAAIIYGGLLALREDDLMRLIAYSSMSHMGYIFLGVSAYSNAALVGAAFHYVSHALLKAALFMSAGVIVLHTGARNMNLMSGLAVKMPVTAICFISGFLSLAGFPPFGGFHSKLILFAGVFDAQWQLAIAALVSTFLTLAYGANAIRRIMFGELKGGFAGKDGINLMTLSILALLVISIALFLYPLVLMKPLSYSFGGALP